MIVNYNKAMKLSEFNIIKSQEVIALFYDVFKHSEGETEGLLIKGFVSDLINTTDKNDLYGFTITLENKIVGCVFFSRLKLPNNQIAFILSPMAIATDHQGKGLGQKLIHYGLEYLKSQNTDLVFTYGDPNFYSKTGFKSLSENIIKAPLKLSYPEGWLVQSLNNSGIVKIKGVMQCVSALNDQRYW